MIRKGFFAGLAAIALVGTANASTITYSLIPNPGPGTFALTAKASAGDNFGIDYYAVEVTGATTISHVNVSPKLTDFDSGNTYGFAFARSADNVAVISAAQDSTGAGIPVYGLGQTAGNLKALAPPADTTGSGKPDAIGTYAAPIVLATGTFPVGGPAPVILQTTTGFIFTTQGAGSAFGQFGPPTTVAINQYPVPEPASIALVGSCLFGALSFRRRRAA